MEVISWMQDGGYDLLLDISKVVLSKQEVPFEVKTIKDKRGTAIEVHADVTEEEARNLWRTIREHQKALQLLHPAGSVIDEAWCDVKHLTEYDALERIREWALHQLTLMIPRA